MRDYGSFSRGGRGRRLPLAGAVAVLVGLAGQASGQLVVGNEPPSPGQEITVIDLSGALAPRVLVTGIDVWALAADNAGGVLYWTTGTGLYKATFTTFGPMTPQLVGTMPQSMTGLAWDSVDNQLVGRASGGLYTIDPNTAATTLVWANTAQDFGGLDFDAPTNAFYATNDTTSTAAPLSGRGIYRIDKPLSAPTITNLSPYPSGDTDIDGLAAGNGRLYLINDGSVAAEPVIHVYNLTTNSFETGPAFSWTNPSTSGIFSGGAWAPALVTISPGTNLVTSASAPPTCTASVGEPLAYVVRITNAGLDASGPVTLTVTLPDASEATFATASPAPSSITPTQLTFDLPAIAGSGAFAEVSITLTAAGSGATAALTATASTTSDTDPSDNTATASTLIQPTPPTTAAARGIFSDNPALANSLIPGGGGRFVTFDHPFASPNGSWWVMRADTDLATSQDSILIRSATGGTPGIAVQEGVTVTGNGTLGIFDVGAEINDDGLVVVSGDDAGPTTSDEFVAVTNGVTFTDIAREGFPVPANGSVTYGTSSGAANILSNGRTGFSFTSSPTGSTGYYTDDGGAIIAQLNVTVPGGTSFVIDTMTTSTDGVGGFALDATGANSIYEADINTGSTTNDKVLVANGTIVLQEGVTVLPGLSAPVNGTARSFTMGPGGVWMVRGSNTSASEDWVIRGTGSTIAQVYKVGDPIHAGATETWQEDSTFTATFFAQLADASGNYVIGGLTSNPDSFADAVLVYNNQTVLARENDPVDLDGDGTFNDAVYIRTFGNDDIAFIDGAVLVNVTLRDAAGALCGANNTDRGEAVVRIPLPVPPCPADFNNSGTVTTSDISAFLTAWFADVVNGTTNADFNHSGSTTTADISAFLSAWFAAIAAGGCP